MNKDTNKLIIVGNIYPDSGKWHQRNDVYYEEGLCPTQTATQYKDAIRVLIGVK